MKVLKFGGTSLGSKEAIERVAAIAGRAVRDDRQVIVVASATSGTTNQLIDLAHRAARGDGSHEADLKAIVDKHARLVENLLLSPNREEGFHAP